MKKLLLITIVALSINANAQWVQQTSSTTNGLNEVCFVNADTGYAVAIHNLAPAIIKTVDGGANWTNIYSGSFSFYSVFFYNNLIGYVGCANSQLLETVDGGATWTGGFVNCCSNGYNSIYATTATNAVAVGGDGAGNGALFRTTTGGTNWTATAITPTGMFDLNCVHFPTLTTGYVVGNQGTMLKTTNAGANWAYITPSVITQYHSVFFTDSLTGYAVGNGGTIIKTVNGGTSWVSQTSGSATAILYDVYFVNASVGYICGSGGILLKTIDGGTNWIAQVSTTALDLHSIDFPTACVGYSVGTASIIIKNTCSTTSINEVNTNSFELYPNPTTSETTINFAVEQKNTTIRITDVLGKEIKTINFTGRQLTIEKGELKQGIYFVQTTDEQKNICNRKVVIQ
jgi:photosystem II stability/assembly factor-like uncharacterized protein